MTSSKSSDVKPSASDRIEHIAAAIEAIREVSAGHTRESFKDDFLVGIGVERLLEIISEASRHIPPELKANSTKINWRQLADLGNWLRHAYHRTDADLIWTMIENDIEPLQVFIEQARKELNR